MLRVLAAVHPNFKLVVELELLFRLTASDVDLRALMKIRTWQETSPLVTTCVPTPVPEFIYAAAICKELCS